MGPESGTHYPRASSPWPAPFPPLPPLPVPRLCSATSPVPWSCPTSLVRSSLRFAFRLPNTVCSSLLCRQTWDLPVPIQGAFPHMRGVCDRARPEHTLRERRTRCCLPSIPRTSAPRSTCCLRSRGLISRLNTQPVPSPVNASTPSSRTTPHDSGPLWFAIPSTFETFTHTTLPIFTGTLQQDRTPIVFIHLLELAG